MSFLHNRKVMKIPNRSSINFILHAIGSKHGFATI